MYLKKGTSEKVITFLRNMSKNVTVFVKQNFLLEMRKHSCMYFKILKSAKIRNVHIYHYTATVTLAWGMIKDKCYIKKYKYMKENIRAKRKNFYIKLNKRFTAHLWYLQNEMPKNFEINLF